MITAHVDTKPTIGLKRGAISSAHEEVGDFVMIGQRYGCTGRTENLRLTIKIGSPRKCEGALLDAKECFMPSPRNR